MEKTQISVEKTQIPRRCQKNLDLVKNPGVVTLIPDSQTNSSSESQSVHCQHVSVSKSRSHCRTWQGCGKQYNLASQTNS